MKLLIRSLSCLSLGISALLFCYPASAQFSKLDELTAQVAKKLKSQKPHLIGVAEFTAANGSSSDQGDYFAWFVFDFTRSSWKATPGCRQRGLQGFAREGWNHSG